MLFTLTHSNGNFACYSRLIFVIRVIVSNVTDKLHTLCGVNTLLAKAPVLKALSVLIPRPQLKQLS